MTYTALPNEAGKPVAWSLGSLGLKSLGSFYSLTGHGLTVTANGAADEGTVNDFSRSHWSGSWWIETRCVGGTYRRLGPYFTLRAFCYSKASKVGTYVAPLGRLLVQAVLEPVRVRQGSTNNGLGVYVIVTTNQ